MFFNEASQNFSLYHVVYKQKKIVHKPYMTSNYAFRLDVQKKKYNN